ncbi:MAG: Rab family GTPase [Candidatus Hodarchaeales archaeon]|jgi:small GTP-binding protein
MAAPLTFKIIVAGPGGVGKTTMLRRYQSGAFTPAAATVGVNFVTQQFEHPNGQIIILSIWDYAGEERFKVLFPGYCTGSKGCLAVFDLSRVDTLLMLSDWIEIVIEKNGYIPTILVGSKADTISTEELSFFSEKASEFAQNHGLRGFYAISSKTGDGIAELFDTLANTILLEMK